MEFKIALDWTPNTNHTGFLVAIDKGFYEEEGLTVHIIDPAEDEYAITPAKKVELGEVDMALCPMESIISYQTKANPFDAVALAAIFQEDISAIVVLSESHIKSPKDLDGCSYASYKARYEDEIVRQMIKNDGGKGTISVGYPEKLGIWQTILDKTFDATWIFSNWEGVAATTKGLQLRSFRMADYGIPYGYSPVIMASRQKVIADKDGYSAFLRATKKGFLFAQEEPEVASAILKPYISEQEKEIDLLKSQQYSSKFYSKGNEWGQLEQSRVTLFLDWLAQYGLEKTKLSYEDVVLELQF